MTSFQEEQELYKYYLTKIRDRDVINAYDLLVHCDLILEYFLAVLGRLKSATVAFKEDYKKELEGSEEHEVSDRYRDLTLKLSVLYDEIGYLDYLAKAYLIRKFIDEEEKRAT